MIKKRGMAKFMAFVLTICMVMSMSPVIAFAGADAGDNQEEPAAEAQNQTQAAEQDEEKIEVQAAEQTEEQAELQTAEGELTPVEYLSPVYKTAGDPKSGLDRMETKICTNYTVITKDLKEWTDKNTGGWYVLSSDVDLNDADGITVSGDVHVILCDGKKYYDTDRGIDVSEGNSLTIYGQAKGTGKLQVYRLSPVMHDSKRPSACIGGDKNKNSGEIVINGGTIMAEGAWTGAGIGGGEVGDGENIIINGGTVEASSRFGAGIGGGDRGKGRNIIINGGVVEANCYGQIAAGIGGGRLKEGSDITINGGSVRAYVDSTYPAVGYQNSTAAGIGGGGAGDGKNISINGGSVRADGCCGGAGIGGGEHADGENIKINIHGDERVEAHGGLTGSGIGGGEDGSSSNIVISSGITYAYGGSAGGAGIGGGEGGNGNDITITKCTVHATGGKDGGAGIGGGETENGGGNGNNITIDDATVFANGGEYGGAGIGGGEDGQGLNIKIQNGANVTAKGDDGGAGIGGGQNGLGRWIKILSGSNVNAYGDEGTGGAGIGGGESAMGDYIEIYDSTVNAWGGDDSAGIGGGEDGGGYNIKTANSTVTAYGDENGAGIGGGEDGETKFITIVSGNVNAHGGYDGAGIGGGDSGKAYNISILGGKVEAYGGNGGGAGIGGGYEANADGIYFENCDVKAVGVGRADAVGSAKSSGKSNNIKVHQGLYLNGNLIQDGNKDRAGDLYNEHNVRISKTEDTAEGCTEHNWTFTAEGPAITATCSNTEHESFSPEQITLCEPENPVFDGNSKEVRVNGFIDDVKTPEVKYYRNGKLLSEAPSKVGTYIARLTLGTATAELAYSIEKGNIEECDIILTPVAFAFNNQVQKPEVTVKNVGGYDMKVKKDYTVTVEEGKNVGTYAVTVKGKDDYSSWKTVSYNINPASKEIKTIKRGKRTLKVKWKKSSKSYRAQTTGYQIMYSTSSSFDSAKTVTVKGKYTSKTIKKLKRHKKYYVMMRVYKTVNGQKYWSTWSKVKVKITR